MQGLQEPVDTCGSNSQRPKSEASAYSTRLSRECKHSQVDGFSSSAIMVEQNVQEFQNRFKVRELRATDACEMCA